MPIIVTVLLAGFFTYLIMLAASILGFILQPVIVFVIVLLIFWFIALS